MTRPRHAEKVVTEELADALRPLITDKRRLADRTLTVRGPSGSEVRSGGPLWAGEM